MRTSSQIILTMFVAMAISICASADVITWTGSDATSPTDFEVAANWSGTQPLPRNTSYNDIARFTDTPSPANKTPNLTVSRSVRGFNFDNSVGWTVSGANVLLRSLQSSGAGVNTVSVQVSHDTDNDFQWIIGTDNTLRLTGGLKFNGYSRRYYLSGGGTLEVTSQIDGYGGSTSIYISDGILKVNASSPVDDGRVRLTSTDAFLQLQTTVANVQTMIDSGKIIDDTGNGLTITDLGGGVAGVSVVPEPATLSLVGLGSLLMLRRRRQ